MTMTWDRTSTMYDRRFAYTTRTTDAILFDIDHWILASDIMLWAAGLLNIDAREFPFPGKIP